MDEDDVMIPYAVILYSNDVEIGRALFMADSPDGAEYETEGILNGLVDEGFAYERYAVVRLEGVEGTAVMDALRQGTGVD